MPANVEIKARIEDFDTFHVLFKKVYEKKDGDGKILEQCDTYFKCDNGRLKLRENKTDDKASAELIFYDRKDTAGPKMSDYVKYDCSLESGTLKELLTKAYEKRGEVKKTRFLYMVDQTRVHIDKVVGTGFFMELEVVLREGQTAEEGQKIATEIMEKLNITDDMLVKGSYIDMMDDKEKKTEAPAAEQKNESEASVEKAAGDSAKVTPAGDESKEEKMEEDKVEEEAKKETVDEPKKDDEGMEVVKETTETTPKENADVKDDQSKPEKEDVKMDDEVKVAKDDTDKVEADAKTNADGAAAEAAAANTEA